MVVAADGTGASHSCATSSISMMLPPAATTPPTATPSEGFTGSAPLETATSSSLPPGRRVTVVLPAANYLAPSCRLPSTHPPPSVKPCRQGGASRPRRVEEADNILRVRRCLKGLLVSVWSLSVVSCREAGAHVGRSSLAQELHLPSWEGAPIPLTTHCLLDQAAAWEGEEIMSFSEDVTSSASRHPLLLSPAEVQLPMQQVGGSRYPRRGQDTPEKPFLPQKTTIDPGGRVTEILSLVLFV